MLRTFSEKRFLKGFPIYERYGKISERAYSGKLRAPSALRDWLIKRLIKVGLKTLIFIKLCAEVIPVRFPKTVFWLRWPSLPHNLDLGEKAKRDQPFSLLFPRFAGAVPKPPLSAHKEKL